MKVTTCRISVRCYARDERHLRWLKSEDQEGNCRQLAAPLHGYSYRGIWRYILVTNFGNYVEIFARRTGAEIIGRDRPMPNATADGITMINFGMGSANAATIMDLLSARIPKAVLRRTRAMAIDMETATIFASGFANRIPNGALMLVSDQPMVPEGVKTKASDRKVTDIYVQRHIEIGVEALQLIRRNGKSVRHLRFEDGPGGD